jgi:hypothetical protein
VCHCICPLSCTDDWNAHNQVEQAMQRRRQTRGCCDMAAQAAAERVQRYGRAGDNREVAEIWQRRQQLTWQLWSSEREAEGRRMTLLPSGAPAALTSSSACGQPVHGVRSRHHWTKTATQQKQQSSTKAAAAAARVGCHNRRPAAGGGCVAGQQWAVWGAGVADAGRKTCGPAALVSGQQQGGVQNVREHIAPWQHGEAARHVAVPLYAAERAPW